MNLKRQTIMDRLVVFAKEHNIQLSTFRYGYTTSVKEFVRFSTNGNVIELELDYAEIKTALDLGVYICEIEAKVLDCLGIARSD